MNEAIVLSQHANLVPVVYCKYTTCDNYSIRNILAWALEAIFNSCFGVFLRFLL